MAKTGQSATVYTNNRWILRFSVVDEDTVGEPALDLTGYTVKFALARLNSQSAPITASPVLDKNSSTHPTEVVITNAVGGVVEVRLDESVTVAILPKDYYMELEVFDTLGNPVVASTGTLTVLPNVVNA